MARIYLERREFGDEVRRLLDRLDEDQRETVAGEYNPPLDVIESVSAVEVVIDLPGVLPDQLQVLFSRGTLIIAGRKLPRACQHHDAAFDLAERSFGRFARAVRIAGAVDAGAARALLTAGELRVVLPRIAERRGHDIRIEVQAR